MPKMAVVQIVLNVSAVMLKVSAIVVVVAMVKNIGHTDTDMHRSELGYFSHTQQQKDRNRDNLTLLRAVGMSECSPHFSNSISLSLSNTYTFQSLKDTPGKLSQTIPQTNCTGPLIDKE